MIRVHDAVPYDMPRGTCPVCGSGEVIHLVIGMPVSSDSGESGPDWVRWVGCVHPGSDRECASCRAVWSLEDGLPVDIRQRP